MFENKKFNGKNKNFNDRNAQQKKVERIQKYYAKMNEDPEKVAKYVREKTIEWLSQSDKTRHQIEEKIFKNINKEHEDLVASILNDYEERGYLSEERFVENFIRLKHYDGFGETKIRQELKSKGVNSDNYLEIFESYDFFEAAREYIERKTEDKEFTEKEMDKFQRKLITRGFSFAQVAPFLAEVKRKKVILEKDDDEADFSDAMTFIEKKMRKGYGVQKIKPELKQKGLCFYDEIFDEFDFFECAKEYKLKKYGEGKSDDFKELNKWKQHMLSRGFNFDQITYAFE